MKTTIFFIVAFILFLFSAKPSFAKSSLSYAKSCNSAIGITPINALGQSYQIRNANGKVVITGKIISSNTFYISIKHLATGSYSFSIGGQELQQFEIY
jgi:hypothetical protein